MVAAPIGPAMHRSEPRPMGLPPCAPGSACLAHFLAEVAHVMRELRPGLAKFSLPFAMRRVHFAAHLLAGVSYLTHGFGAGLDLGPIKGTVYGRNTGKNFL